MFGFDYNETAGTIEIIENGIYHFQVSIHSAEDKEAHVYIMSMKEKGEKKTEVSCELPQIDSRSMSTSCSTLINVSLSQSTSTLMSDCSRHIKVNKFGSSLKAPFIIISKKMILLKIVGIYSLDT